MTTAKIFDVACKRQGTAHATHKTHIFNLSERCRNKSLTPSTECSFFANAHYAYRKMEWTHPPLFPTRNNSNPPKNRCVCFSLGIFTCLSAETRTVSSFMNWELCVARLGVDTHLSTVPSNPTSRYSRRDDGQRGARVVPLGHQSNRSVPLTGSTRRLFAAPTFLLISLSTICPIDRPKVFLVSLHVLRIPLENTFAYFVVRIGLLFNESKKYE
jgi:hypothetical protein